ncbi:hypothetical protein RYX36_002976, partial [Vicia faba]
VKVYKGVGWRSDFIRTHFDQFSPPYFYTKVCIVGVGADSVKKKTSVKMDNETKDVIKRKANEIDKSK